MRSLNMRRELPCGLTWTFAVLSVLLLSGIAVAQSEATRKAVQTETVGARNSKLTPAQTVYECHRTDAKVTIDGRLDEEAWGGVAAMPFVGITDGSGPPFITWAGMLWNDEYLYAGYYFEEPDIRAVWALDEANCGDALSNAILGSRNVDPSAPWGYMECSIMYVDRFAKLLLDPDGDGVNYIEFQFNPLNNCFDAWYKQGFSEDKWGNRERFPSVEWKCPGLLSATRIDGTVNASHDVDKGWSLEIAIPLSALAPFTKGACPPAFGDVWGGHLGRIYRDRVGGENEYWVWPFLEARNSHLPDRYGKIIFRPALPASAAKGPLAFSLPAGAETPHFERLFGWGSLKEDQRYIDRLVETGVTDIIESGRISPNAVELYARNNIGVYPCVTLSPDGWKEKYPGVPPPLQKMTDAEVAVRELLNGARSPHRPVFGKGGGADAPPDWNVTGRQKGLLDALDKSNFMAQSKYQWGGEEEGNYFGGRGNGVLTLDLLCFNNPQVAELVKSRIKDALAIPGVRGVGFDFFGYQNYHACFCPLCEGLYGAYCVKEHLGPGDEKSRQSFSLARLVEFNNEMTDYAHSVKPGAIVVNHIYPVYMPDPLYGNRLKVDFCGQTAAWYFYWDPWRIEKYSRVISGEQEKYWKGVKGVAFIGYYRLPQFPVKTPEKVEAELRAIWRGGSKYLMICGLDDLMRNPDVCEVFKAFCGPVKPKAGVRDDK